MASANIYNFITVCCKRGEYDVREFQTLRRGLQGFLQEYIPESEHEEGERQRLEALPDKELLAEILKLGECVLIQVCS